MPAAIFEAKPRPSTVSAKVPCTSSQARTQREQTMHFDGIELEIRVGPVDRRVEMVGAGVAVADFAQRRPRRRRPAVRNCRWRRRSGSPADGRRYTAPSRRGAGCASLFGCRCAPSCRARPAWCRRPACRCGPRSPPGTARQDAERVQLSVAQSFGTLMPASIAARMIEVPSGTVTSWPSIGQRHLRRRDDELACRSRVPGSAA